MKKTFLKFAVATLCCSMIATSFTACTDDTTDDSAEIAEKFNFDYLTALANNDGTITISGTVTTNKKLKKFTLTSTTRFDENNNAIEYDLYRQLTDKMSAASTTNQEQIIDLQSLVSRRDSTFNASAATVKRFGTTMNSVASNF